jgi:hypothetical protein
MDGRIPMAATVDMILEEIARLSIEDQEMVDEIIRKRTIEGKCDEIHAEYLSAIEERKQGKTKSGSVDDLFAAIG